MLFVQSHWATNVVVSCNNSSFSQCSIHFHRNSQIVVNIYLSFFYPVQLKLHPTFQAISQNSFLYYILTSYSNLLSSYAITIFYASSLANLHSVLCVWIVRNMPNLFSFFFNSMIDIFFLATFDFIKNEIIHASANQGKNRRDWMLQMKHIIHLFYVCLFVFSNNNSLNVIDIRCFIHIDLIRRNWVHSIRMESLFLTNFIAFI